MKTLKCKISIGKYSFEYVVNLKIKHSVENLTRVCEIELPRKLEWKGKPVALGNDSILNVGDKVTVKLSYNKTPEAVFKGYLARIKPGTRVGLVVEDEMYQLKKNNIKKSWKKVKLSTVLAAVVPAGLTYECPDISLGQLRLTNVSTAQVLEYLKMKYGLFSYIKNDKLLVGLAYWPEYALRHIFHFQKNIADDGHPEYRKSDSVKLKVKAISIMSNNKKYDIEIGDSEGDQRTLYFYNVEKADLEQLANSEIKKLKYDGFRGKLKAFGEPLAQIGDIAVLQDDILPDRNGDYEIKANEIKFGSKGFKQIIELGNKV